MASMKMSLDVVMGSCFVLLTACSSAPPVPPPPKSPPPVAVKTPDQVLICTGKINQQQYPLGKLPARAATMLVVIPQDLTLTRTAIRYDDMSMTYNGKVVDQLSNLSPICSRDRFPNGTCKAQQNQDRLDIAFYVAGVGSATLALDKKTQRFAYGSGGMDGGMDFDGACKAK